MPCCAQAALEGDVCRPAERKSHDISDVSDALQMSNSTDWSAGVFFAVKDKAGTALGEVGVPLFSWRANYLMILECLFLWQLQDFCDFGLSGATGET